MGVPSARGGGRGGVDLAGALPREEPPRFVKATEIREPFIYVLAEFVR